MSSQREHTPICARRMRDIKPETISEEVVAQTILELIPLDPWEFSTKYDPKGNNTVEHSMARGCQQHLF